MMTVHQYFLLKLAEECAEVSQRALKQMQFGKEESQAQGPSTTKIEATNAQRLRQEVNDLLAVLDCLVDIGELPEISEWGLIQEKGKKKEKLLKYLNYSRSLGKVEDKNSKTLMSPMGSCGTTKASPGWYCTRTLGHPGPCAAVATQECQSFYGADDICGLPPESPIHDTVRNPMAHTFIKKSLTTAG